MLQGRTFDFSNLEVPDLSLTVVGLFLFVFV